MRCQPTLLRLPGEIRNRIYEELLPTVDASSRPLDRLPLREDGNKATTIFMSTCRQIYDESASILH